MVREMTKALRDRVVVVVGAGRGRLTVGLR